VIMPDQNTGSNNMQVSALTQTFEVRYASKAAGECRAQKAWRVDDLPNSEVQGAGKAWFYADASVKCTAKNPDGTCKETKKVYAMDKWCKANRCLPHTLGSHCEIAAPTALRQVACAVTDTFGECCQSGVVDQCGVCDGDGSTCKIETYRSAFVADTATTDLVFDANHTGHDCPTHSPCAHKNTGDKSCVPKTFNSAKKVNEDFEYCYKNMVGDNSHWKKGEWDDANGQMSIASGLHADGNTDCFCPVGTVDVTDRAIVGETAIDDFKVEFKKKIADIKQQVADKLIEATVETDMLAKDIMLQNTEGGIELWSSKCADAMIGQGKKITLTDAKFAPTGGMAWDTNTAKKGDEEVGCVRVPPLVTVSTYKVGCKKDVPDQKKYKTFVNMKTTVEWFAPESDEAKLFGGIEANGDVLKPTAEIVGTEADAAEMACSASPGSLTCSKNSECRSRWRPSRRAPSRAPTRSPAPCATASRAPSTSPRPGRRLRAAWPRASPPRASSASSARASSAAKSAASPLASRPPCASPPAATTASSARRRPPRPRRSRRRPLPLASSAPAAPPTTPTPPRPAARLGRP